ncbi:hypothetical protein GQ44DRAFT_698837 [Phaeosphaeriaceae sp. PMI808]|nr:hypothetical protein GQ44DRAFT_698837 [Phaeosphaeriaceae sp. PMI808]
MTSTDCHMPASGGSYEASGGATKILLWVNRAVTVRQLSNYSMLKTMCSAKFPLSLKCQNWVSMTGLWPGYPNTYEQITTELSHTPTLRRHGVNWKKALGQKTYHREDYKDKGICQTGYRRSFVRSTYFKFTRSSECWVWNYRGNFSFQFFMSFMPAQQSLMLNISHPINPQTLKFQGNTAICKLLISLIITF